MQNEAHPKVTAAETLDRIRRGGTHLLLAAYRSVADTQSLLDDGDFRAAMKSAAQLHQKIGALAAAESSLGTAADARVLRSCDVELGMTVADLGEVTAVELCPCGLPHCDTIVLTIGEQPVHLPADAEIIVTASVQSSSAVTAPGLDGHSNGTEQQPPVHTVRLTESLGGCD